MFPCGPDPRFDFDDGDFGVLRLAIREELEDFEAGWAAWLLSAEGRFAQYYAARERALAA